MYLNTHCTQKKKKETKIGKTDSFANPSNQSANIAIRNEHPLLNPLILETVLIFCKSHDTKENNSFSSLRLVCKLWDIEVCKNLRRQTQIPLPRLLTPYPEGLGWEWNSSHHYQSPYPDTPVFQSIKVTVTTCKVIKDPKVIQWFKRIGGQVRSLEYSCAINCYHQNHFLGNCLQSWCPNLESLYLSGIQCFTSLLYILEEKPEKERKFEKDSLNCGKLRSLTISVESDEFTGVFAQSGAEKSDVLLTGRRRVTSAIGRGTRILRLLITHLPARQIEFGKPFYQLIEKQSQNLPKNYFKEVFIPKYFGSRNLDAVDWGVMGLILKVAPLKKIVIRKLIGKQQCRDLTLFLLYHPSTFKSTLEHLEFYDNVFVGKDSTCLKSLSMLKCPLKYLRLDNLLPTSSQMGHFNDLLVNFASTLNTLEIACDEHSVSSGRVPPILQVPMLPILKKLVHRNIGILSLEVVGLSKNCPKLEICKFSDKKEIAEDPELQVVWSSYESKNRVELVKAMGSLVKLDLELNGQDELDSLLEWMGAGQRKLEDLRVSIKGIGYAIEEIWSEIFNEHLGNIEGLKFLELDFKTDKVCLSKEVFRNGFAQMDGLISLKIKNFWVLEDEKEKIERSVKHVPFVTFHGMQTYSATRLRIIAMNNILPRSSW